MGIITALKKLFSGTATNGNEDIQTPDAYGAPVVDQTIMVPKEDVNDRFVRHEVTFDEILKPGEQATVRWQYLGGVMHRGLIETVIPSCGCTANITWGDVGIQAVYTNDEKKVPPEGKYITKQLTVYFKSTHGMVPDGRGGMMYDPAKPRRVLSFTGKVTPK